MIKNTIILFICFMCNIVFCQEKVYSIDANIGFAEDGIASSINFNYHQNPKNLYQASLFISLGEEKYQDYKINYIDETLNLTYNRRVYSNSLESTFNLFIGAGAIIGYELINNDRYILDNGAELKIRSKLIYGTLVKAQAELYLSDNIYLTSQIVENYHINSDLGKFLFYGSIGIRIYII